MQQVGVDPESGELDADILTTGSSRQQNECKSAVESYLKQASAETSIPLNDIYSDIGEFSVDEILTVLDEFKQSGDVFEPQSDEYRWSGNL
jgi:replicative DNA helicase Mcm